MARADGGPSCRSQPGAQASGWGAFPFPFRRVPLSAGEGREGPSSHPQRMGPPARRAGARDVGERRLEDRRWHECLGLHHGGHGSGHRVCPDCATLARRRRRDSAGRHSVRNVTRRARCQYRHAEVVSPTRPSRSLGLRLGGGADAVHRGTGEHAHSGRGAPGQEWLDVLLRSSGRQADFRHGRASGATAVRRSTPCVAMYDARPSSPRRTARATRSAGVMAAKPSNCRRRDSAAALLRR